MKKILPLYLLIVLLFSCKKNKPSDNNNSGNNNNTDTSILSQHLVLPSATDLLINSYNSAHFVCFDSLVSPKNKLFIFLPGTTGSPEYYKLIVKKAALLGYHAIGLMYPNSADMYTYSAVSIDNTQFGKCRQEIFDGSNQTSGVNVNASNCIKNRLYKLLIYLQQQYPNQNWQQFLINNEADWTKCILAGHSQGGGHAFYIAKQVNVIKAIAFSSIDWNTTLNTSADWVSQSGATPVSQFFSINSINDQLFSYANVQTQLAVMGLTGPPINIDTNVSPYSNSHTLITSATPATTVIVPDHNVLCLDSYVPKTSAGDAIPTIANAWEYLINQ
jgi:hypothetical protein